MPKVLIIEDTPDNMELINFILKKNGYDTAWAKIGQQGIDMALADRPDFIVLDIQLPDMDGTEVLKTIRQSDINSSIPIIAMTSYAMSGDRDKLIAAGCNGYIEKPIDPLTVMAEIQEVLEKANKEGN